MGLVAAAGPRRQPGARERDADHGEHEHERAAGECDRQAWSTSRTNVRSGRTISMIVGVGWARLMPGWSAGLSPLGLCDGNVDVGVVAFALACAASVRSVCPARRDTARDAPSAGSQAPRPP